MDEDRHRNWARRLNGEVWQWLDASDRTEAETYRMVHLAHASLYHWLQAGTVVHEQRGEWLVAHVYAVLGHGEAALRHAQRCMSLTEENSAEVQDFDVAYAHEGLARANAVLGHFEEAAVHKEKARTHGWEIAGEKDRIIFEDDIQRGEWFDVE